MKFQTTLIPLFATLILLASPAYASKAKTDILASYLVIQETLAKDTLEGVSSAAADIEKKAGDVKGPEAETFTKIQDAAQAVSKATSIKAARHEFKSLSQAMIEWNRKAKNPGIEELYCSMAPGSWLQKSGPVANPYYGKQMLRCGERRK